MRGGWIFRGGFRVMDGRKWIAALRSQRRKVTEDVDCHNCFISLRSLAKTEVGGCLLQFRI